MIKLSIIIPYYKTLELTKKLLDALIPQLTSETEVILIDDGCNELELDKYKIKVIHQTNGGVSKARNKGLDVATGEYIAFIDSDDTIPSYYIDKILNKINNSEFDYCLMSWEALNNSGIKEVIITDLPPKWNTSIWNCIYKKDLIGKNRFDETKTIVEDEDFNKRVRVGKKENITDIMYYYYWSRPNSLCSNYSQGKIDKDLPIKTSLLLYQKAISEIGGVEKFINEFVKEYYKKYDITLVYSTADLKQLIELKKMIRCIKFDNQKFICDKYLCVSNQYNIAENVESTQNWYADMIHADYDAMKWIYKSHHKTNVHIAVSEVARKSFVRQNPKEKCELIYNLLKIDKPKPVIRLITCARMDSPEKGYWRLKEYANRMNDRGIPFIWEVFTERPKDAIKGVAYLPTTLDIDSYIANADWYWNGSDTESWGYSTAQAFELGTPIICTDYPAIHEQGFVDGVNGILLKQDMSNIDEIIDKMLELKLKGFKYKKKDNPKQWVELLGELDKPNYKYIPEVIDFKNGYVVEVLKSCFYIVEGRQCEKGDLLQIETRERLDYLINNNCVRER